jgi:prophage regulatory protein
MKLISINDTFKKIKVGRSTGYVLMKEDPTFPKTVKISLRRRAIIEEELEAWLQQRVAARDSGNDEWHKARVAARNRKKETQHDERPAK